MRGRGRRRRHAGIAPGFLKGKLKESPNFAIGRWLLLGFYGHLSSQRRMYRTVLRVFLQLKNTFPCYSNRGTRDRGKRKKEKNQKTEREREKESVGFQNMNCTLFDLENFKSVTFMSFLFKKFEVLPFRAWLTGTNPSLETMSSPSLFCCSSIFSLHGVFDRARLLSKLTLFEFLSVNVPCLCNVQK